ncbi:hypothetical protein ACJ41O_010107 [Fusarium nematophilum]
MPLNISSLHSPPQGEFSRFASRRSVVHSTKGIVACTQPLAASCGLRILQAGGNAADAAVAVAAGLNMTEPCSTGIGGDMFILYYEAKTSKVSAMNGSGRSGAKGSLEAVRASIGLADGISGEIKQDSPHAVTVPGAAAGWCDTVAHFGSGKVSIGDVLAPAIELGEKGFPVSEIASDGWHEQEELLRGASPNFAEMMKKDSEARDGVRPPRPGEIMTNPTLAQTFRELSQGKENFYKGRIAQEIINSCRAKGSFLELQDLEHHLEAGSELVEPISLKLDDCISKDKIEIWEHPPNGQGIVALMALGIIQEIQKAGKMARWGPEDHNTAPYLHAIIEALRLAFADGNWFVTDPSVVQVPSALISSEYLARRAGLFSPTQAAESFSHGAPFESPALNSCDTVYFAVTDQEGNAASFINSNYQGFGTGIVPKGCGFTLQNRGSNFSLDPAHPNRIEPRKRPYHTIIPGLATNGDGSLHSVFGVMGGFMQPQGHVQVLLAQLVGGLNPQQALDCPRVCIQDGVVWAEEGLPEETVEGLRRLGHKVEMRTGKQRSRFGRGQIIRSHIDPLAKTMIWSAGSDLRGDGAAFPAL